MQDDVFSSFYDRYYWTILTVAQQNLQGSAAAEDVTAEVFRIVWKHCRQGYEPSFSWAYRVLRNLIRNEYRRSFRADRLQQKAQAESVLAQESDRDAKDDAIEVRRAIDRLGDEDRKLIRMAYWEDLSAKEMAGILGCKEGTVRVRLFRARNRLKVYLDSIGFERGDVADG